MKTLFPEQVLSRNFLINALKTHGAALCSSETGTGKTIVAIEVARSLGLTPLVLCPKPVIPSWQRTFKEQGVDFIKVTNYEKIKGGRTEHLSKRGKSRFEWNLPKGSLLIFDEFHKCKAHASQNALMLAAAKTQGMRTLLLSATPFEDPTEMKAIGYTLGLHRWADFYSWSLQHGCKMDQWKQLVFDTSDSTSLNKINARLYSTVAHKLTREDLGAHFAECTIDYTPLDFDDKGEIQKILREVEGPLMALADRVFHDGDDAIAIVKILRARQRVELLKVPLIAQYIEEYIAAGMSVFVALNFSESIEALKALIKAPCVEIRGGQSATARQNAIDQFQTNRVRVCLANVAAGGTGVSLHDMEGGYPRISLISPSYNAKELQQALGRVDRAGAKSNVIQRVLTAAGTVEETILSILQQKIANMSLLNTQNSAIEAPKPNQNDKVTTETAEIVPAAPAEEQQAHAKYSPSALKYYHKCPGFTPTTGDNPASIMGTRIHLALETDDDRLLQNEHERYIANQCRLSINHIQRLHNMEYATDLCEIRLQIQANSESTFGTCDRLFMSGDKAVAADYKTGRGSVDDAQVNWQAKAYTLGVFQTYPEIDQLDFYFIIPQRDEISHATFHRKQMPELADAIEQILKNAAKAHACWDSGKAPLELLKADTLICRYCANAGNATTPAKCPKILGIAVEVAKRYSPELDIKLPETTHASDNDDPEVISQMLKLIPILEKWADGTKHKAKVMAVTQGIQIPDFEIKTRTGTRTITDPLMAWKGVESLGVDLEEFLKAVGSVSVSAFEKMVGEKAKRGEKKKLVADIMSQLYAHGALKQNEDSQILSAIK